MIINYRCSHIMIIYLTTNYYYYYYSQYQNSSYQKLDLNDIFNIFRIKNSKKINQVNLVPVIFYIAKTSFNKDELYKNSIEKNNSSIIICQQ